MKRIVMLSVIIFTMLTALYAGGKVRLGINIITANDVSRKTAFEVSMKIYKKLRELKGAEQVIFRDKNDFSKSANRQLYGTIGKFGSGYVLTVKVSDGTNGRLLFSETKIIKNGDNIDKVIEVIAKKIGDKEEIW